MYTNEQFDLQMSDPSQKHIIQIIQQSSYIIIYSHTL